MTTPPPSSATTTKPRPLLGPDDPQPFEVVNAEGTAAILLVCDHASRRVPRSLGNLGLDADKFDRHIAFDIGAAEVTRRLARLLDAPAVLAGFSRLVVDCNRAPGDPTMMPEVSDEVAVPANQTLDEAQVLTRLDTIYWPYHQAIARALIRLRRRGPPPLLFSIHSFTPSLGGVERYWDIGALWNRDPRLATPLIEGLRTNESLHVGDNEPYSGRDLAFTIDLHGGAAGLANCAVEIRQDTLSDADGIERWANLLCDAIRPVLESGTANCIERF